eukprot:5067734-Amphidinium_carterae.2
MHYDKVFKSDVKPSDEDHPRKDDVKPSDVVLNVGVLAMDTTESKPASSGTQNQTTPSKPAS